jgi:hypothetical protein
MISRGNDIADVERASDFEWPDIVRELRREGLSDPEIHLVLGERSAWVEQATVMKEAGSPYDEAVFQLREMAAEWGDVARALMEVGLSPADMLRAVLPCTEQQEDSWAVVQASVCDSPLDGDMDELRGVMAYYLITPLDVVEEMTPGSREREVAVERLGLED